MSDLDKKKKKFFSKKNQDNKKPSTATEDLKSKELLDIRSTDPTHAKDWLNAKGLRANELYPRLGNIFITFDYPPISDIEIPKNFDTLSKAKQFLWQEQVRDRNKDLRSLELAKSTLFAEMLASMSKDSIDQVRQSVVKKAIQERRESHEDERQRRVRARATIKERNKARKAQAASSASTTDSQAEPAAGGKKKKATATGPPHGAPSGNEFLKSDRC